MSTVSDPLAFLSDLLDAAKRNGDADGDNGPRVRSDGFTGKQLQYVVLGQGA